MHYMLIFTEGQAQFDERKDPEKSPAYWGAWSAYVAALGASGVVVSGNGLQEPYTGTILKIRDGKRHIQDGPHPDSKEHLGGYFIIDVPDLDTALEWAARSPSSSYASTEIRPVLPPPTAAV